ncbi:MAG: anthranilate synthase component I family protein [Bacteroidia bacterium]
MKNKLQEYIAQQGLARFKELVYAYADKHKYQCILDSCQLNTGVYGGEFEFLAAIGATQVYTSWSSFEQATTQVKWLFGVLGYDVKNHFETLSSENNAVIDTPELLFFEPQILLAIDKNQQVSVLKGDLSLDFFDAVVVKNKRDISPVYSPISRSDYIQKIEEIQELIRGGEVYELNYCVPYSHSFNAFQPLLFHLDLLQKSPVPMGAYLRANQLYLCGASMERFLMKQGNTLVSQPIKGTIKKGQTPEEDVALITQLKNSEKDRAENVMIVDLVRNDLNRVCKSGTVKVKELFGIYSYLQVHQMISTVEGEVLPEVSISDILKATFPMGSMTGAPKIAAMKYIEGIENFKRGWYSGALGYIAPDGDFDFNVVIRSVLCDTNNKVLNYNAGGAITIDSIAEQEWMEVQLKTKAITEVLKGGENKSNSAVT